MLEGAGARELARLKGRDVCDVVYGAMRAWISEGELLA